MSRTMGIGALGTACFKQKFRWMMTIQGVIGDLGGSVSILPPLKSARPNISFKEMQVEHLTETIYFPSKPDYKPITVTAYDVVTNDQTNPVFNWIKTCFDAQQGKWSLPASGFIRDASLVMLNGCGDTVETWTYENCWVQQCDFNDLGFDSSDVVMCDLTLRYGRAFVVPPT